MASHTAGFKKQETKSERTVSLMSKAHTTQEMAPAKSMFNKTSVQHVVLSQKDAKFVIMNQGPTIWMTQELICKYPLPITI